MPIRRSLKSGCARPFAGREIGQREAKLVEKISDYRFTSPDVPIVELRVRVATIADQFGLTLDHWDEDGLGPACGMFIRLSSGVIVLLTELEHAIRHHGAAGPIVHAGASEVVEFGIEPLVSETLESLKLGRDTIGWMAPKEVSAHWKAYLRTEMR